MKHEIELTTGCTLDSLLIDGKQFEKLNVDDARLVIKKLLDLPLVEDMDLYNEIIRTIAYSKGEFIDGYKCEQCGDWVETYNLKYYEQLD